MSEQTAHITTKSSQTMTRHTWHDLLKRIFDLWFALFGLIFLAPLFLLIAIWIRQDSPGPVFFRGKRSAQGGGTFEIIKFRTMHEDPDAYNGPKVTAKHDQRITPVGRWLRTTKLNELPQLWNVVRGEMSLVGPRPEDPDIVSKWPVDAQNEVLSVKPGITSPASVLYRNEEELLASGKVMKVYLNEILPSKLRLDQLYVRNRTFLLDVDVLFWTFLVLLPQWGSYKPPEENLFWGPVSRLIRRYLNWFFIDLLTTFTAFALVGGVWRSMGPIHVGWMRSIVVALGFSILFSFTGAILGTNRIVWSDALASDVFDLLPAFALATVAVVGLNQALAVFPIGLVLSAAVVSFAGFILVRYRSRLLTGLAERLLSLRKDGIATGEKVLIIGGGDAGQFAAWMLARQNNGNRALRIVGFIDDDLYKQGTRIRGFHVLGKRDDILRIVDEHDIGIIIFAIHNIQSEEKQKVIELCNQTSARLIMLPDFLGQLNKLSAAQTMREQTASEETAGRLGGKFGRAALGIWLAELEVLAKDGDLEGLIARIKDYRDQLSDDQS